MSLPEASIAFTAPSEPWPLVWERLDDNIECQLSKLYAGLSGDRYAAPDGAEASVLPPRYPGMQTGWLRPQMIRELIGRGCTEFEGHEQQDAAEYLVHLLRLYGRRAEPRHLPSELEQGFELGLEDRFVCQATKQVKLCARKELMLTLSIPTDQADNVEERTTYLKKREKEQLRSGLAALGQLPSGASSEPLDPVVLNIPFLACLNQMQAEEIVEDFGPQRCIATKSVSISRFPRYLVIKMQRYLLDDEWKPFKVDCAVDLPDEIDLEHLRATGLREGDVEMADAREADDDDDTSVLVEVIQGLTEMGFHPHACVKAARATRGQGCNTTVAMEWLLSHMEDPDINDAPDDEEEEAKTQADVPRQEVSAAAQGLMGMGFSQSQAEYALVQTDGSPDAAAEWLFGHMDELETLVRDRTHESTTAKQEEAPPMSEEEPVKGDNAQGRYTLRGFISHIGRNPGCGHYVVHVKKAARWIKYDDSRVFESSNPPKQFGYLYLYERAE